MTVMFSLANITLSSGVLFTLHYIDLDNTSKLLCKTLFNSYLCLFCSSGSPFSCIIEIQKLNNYMRKQPPYMVIWKKKYIWNNMRDFRLRENEYYFRCKIICNLSQLKKLVVKFLRSSNPLSFSNSFFLSRSIIFHSQFYNRSPRNNILYFSHYKLIYRFNIRD